jgi:hypothetical protein
LEDIKHFKKTEMKKIFTTVTALACSALLFAQSPIPNGGFETWTGGNPTGWGSSDGIITGFGQPDPGGVERDTAMKASGTSSVRVETKTISVFGQTQDIPGVVSLGTLALDIATQNINIKGIAYTSRPDSFSFAYKYTSSNSGLDTGAAVVRLTKWVNGDTKEIGLAFLNVSNQGSFVTVKGKVNYTSLLAPDSLFIQLLSSASFSGGYVGSKLWADDLAFHGLDTAFKAYMTPTGSDVICVGESYDLEGDDIAGFTYRWLNNNAAISGATSYNYTTTTSGNYSLEVTNGSRVDTSDIFQLLVSPLPTVGLTGNPDTLRSTGAAITLVGGSPAGGTFSGTGVTGSTFNPATAGPGLKTITYTYSDANGCENTATETIFVKNTTSIEAIAKDYNITVFPNPAINEFTVTSDDRLVGGEIIISDIAGKIVGKTAITGNDTKVDASTWSNGNYVFQIMKDKKAIAAGKMNIAK